MRRFIFIVSILLPLFFFTACNPSEAPEAYAPSAATITASPNPVSTGEGYGKTTITWDTGDGTEGEVFVSVDGGKERLFHIGAEGSSEISWIQAGKTTEFRLYEGAEHAKMLAKTQVTAHK
jgi:hypothetical protein